MLPIRSALFWSNICIKYQIIHHTFPRTISVHHKTHIKQKCWVDITDESGRRASPKSVDRTKALLLPFHKSHAPPSRGWWQQGIMKVNHKPTLCTATHNGCARAIDPYTARRTQQTPSRVKAFLFISRLSETTLTSIQQRLEKGESRARPDRGIVCDRPSGGN